MNNSFVEFAQSGLLQADSAANTLLSGELSAAGIGSAKSHIEIELGIVHPAGAGLIHHTQGTPHRFFHLKDNALKHSVCHNMFPLFRIDQRRRGTQDAAAHNAPFPAAGAPWLRGTSRADLPIFVTRSYFSVLQTARL